MLDRITSDAAILAGKPIIRGTRISVEIILEWIASGATRDDIVRKHPHLSTADVEQALAYAASASLPRTRRHTPSTIGPCRRTRTSNAVSSRWPMNSAKSCASVRPSSRSTARRNCPSTLVNGTVAMACPSLPAF